MTNQDKQLLLKDLCARLPYGVKVKNTHSDTVYDLKEYMYCLPTALATNFKPYLRPMSSMTEEERGEYMLCIYMTKVRKGDALTLSSAVLIDWLCAHHLDFRGLIPMGLALEAPEDMYKTE